MAIIIVNKNGIKEVLYIIFYSSTSSPLPPPRCLRIMLILFRLLLGGIMPWFVACNKYYRDDGASNVFSSRNYTFVSSIYTSEESLDLFSSLATAPLLLTRNFQRNRSSSSNHHYHGNSIGKVDGRSRSRPPSRRGNRTYNWQPHHPKNQSAEEETALCVWGEYYLMIITHVGE